MGLVVQIARQSEMKEYEAMVPPEHRDAFKKEFQAEMEQIIAESKADEQKMLDDYSADKSARDAAAFKVLDTNNDGTLQLSEFLAAFEPENEKNFELQVALG